ncbi:hypothetical protein INR49_012050 [Caranx melampygus]|nr:hypothetical protein INR49_012050 [Caranx melampygus]
MKAKSIISDLHLKFAERTWNDTFQLVRRCMEKSRDESKPCEPLVRSLERLQEEFSVSSMNTMRSRLEMIAKQQGMGFHVTEATCYLTADLFYLEVVLLQCGGVELVKVAPQGGAPVPSESLLQLLRLKNFADFSMRLAGLFTQYNIPGEKLIKKIMIQITDIKAGVQAAQVTVCVSAVSHKLQMASVIPQPPQLDPQGYPVFLPLNEVPNETLPACFLLKLQPAVPVLMSFVNKLSQITDVAIAEVDLQWAPLPKLLLRGSLSPNSHVDTLDGQDAIFIVVCSVCDLHFEVLLESDTSFSVTFHQPNTDSLAVLLVNVSDSHHIACSLFGAGACHPSMDEYISTVMKRCMSVPLTLRTLYTKLEEITSAPLSPGTPATSEAENDHSAPPSAAVTDTNSPLTKSSEGAAVPEDGFSVSGPACYAMSVTNSELPPDINTSPAVNPYPFTPVGVFSH